MSINAVPLPSKSTLYFALAYALTFFAKPHYAVALLFKSTPSHFVAVHRFALP
jgi:hypothetical protein|nr:MAG TPA: hypothetical protein [Caudoviricetes sp.]